MARAKGTGLELNPVTIGKYYLSYFNPQFLFFKGDYIHRHSPAKIGELYYFEIITVIWGLISIIRLNNKPRPIILLWLFLYPLPAAITSPVHALRAISGVPLFTIISAYGLVKIINFLETKRKGISIFIIGGILLASLAIITRVYFISYPLYTTHAWQYGIREAIQYAENHNYQCVVMSNKIYFQKCGSLHTFVPFYTKHPPQEYQEKYPITPVERKQLFLGKANHQIGKYNIAPLNKDSINSNKNCLYIIEAKDLKNIKAQGYKWSEVHTVKDKRGVEYLKLIELS